MFLKLLVDLIKLCGDRFFLAVGSHNFLSCDHLIDESCLFASCLRLQLKHGVSSVCNETCYKQRHGCNEDNHACNTRVDRQHK